MMEKKKKNINICQTCHQDMRALPHKGMKDQDCPQCGQVINWKAALKKRRGDDRKSLRP